MRYVLWTEGPSDYGLHHVLNWLLFRNGVQEIEDPIMVNKNHDGSFVELYQNGAFLFNEDKEKKGTGLYFLHIDSDSDKEAKGKGPQTRRQHLAEVLPPRIEENLTYVCIVPVQEMEAWLLTLTDIRPKRIEAVTDPKTMFKAWLKQQRMSPDYTSACDLCWARLVENQDALRRLQELPAFQRLMVETKEAIEHHGLTRY